MGASPLVAGVCSTLLTEKKRSLRTIHTRAGAGEELLLTNALSSDDLTKHDVLVIEVRSFHGGDEELGSIGVGASVGHRQEERLVMFPEESLIFKLFPVYRLSTGPVTGGEITALDHETTRIVILVRSNLRGTAFTHALITRWKILPA